MSGEADLVPVTVPPDPGPQRMTVQGGVGSISFQWEELSRGAQQLRVHAESLRAVLRQCDELQWQLQMLLQRQAVPGADGSLAVGVLDDARAALTRGDDRLRDAAQRIDTCRLTYQAADALAQLATAAVNVGVGTVEYHVRHAIGVVNAGGTARPAPLQLERAGEPSEITLDGSVHGLLQRVEMVREEGDGVFEVLEVATDDGPVFVVVLPGTQGSAVTATSNPFDPTGVVEAVQYDSVFVADAVHGALASAGAGAGDRVMMVGYSQGGMHAANLARNPAIVDNYQLELVLTAGSPTGPTLSGSTSYLHLEHADDWVHQVDGTANPEEQNRVTVTLQGPTAEVPDGDKGLGPAHKLDTYLTGAAAVDGSQHPSIVAPVGALSALIGANAAARRHVFTAQRQRRRGRTATLPADPGQRPGDQ